MRIVRSIFAALLGLSLIVVPMAAVAMSHASKAEMSMNASGDDCPCCNAAHKCPSDTCMLKCYMGPALFVGRMASIRPLPQVFAPMGAAQLSPFAARPELPPPRS
jgi:hypothetical protein